MPSHVPLCNVYCTDRKCMTSRWARKRAHEHLRSALQLLWLLEQTSKDLPNKKLNLDGLPRKQGTPRPSLSAHKLGSVEWQKPNSLAGVGEDDDGPVFVFILECLDHMDEVGIFHFLRHKQVTLIQLFHCLYTNGKGEVIKSEKQVGHQLNGSLQPHVFKKRDPLSPSEGNLVATEREFWHSPAPEGLKWASPHLPPPCHSARFPRIAKFRPACPVPQR